MDYEQFSDVLILSSTVSKQCVSLEIINDLSLERNESMAVSLVLVGEQESVQISLQQADVLITDDDGMHPTQSSKLRAFLMLSVQTNVAE